MPLLAIADRSTVLSAGGSIFGVIRHLTKEKDCAFLINEPALILISLLILNCEDYQKKWV
jgi:hypothetical protein